MRQPSLRPLAARLCLAASVALAASACESGTAAPSDFDALAQARLPTIEGTVDVEGLQADVEVIRDRWGVPHIYADNQDDLFFAQGFVQAQDRLWQMDMWRRAGEGRLSEIFGPEMLEHDRTARLLRYRGSMDEELASYHPEGRRIMEAFAAGVNAYIAHATAEGTLPVEYALTGLTPDPWTVESSLYRTETAMPLGDVRRELSLAREVAELGAAEANRRSDPTPYRDLVAPTGVDYSLITDAVEDATRGFEGTRVADVPLVAPYDAWTGAVASLNLGAQENSPGSNNWALSGARTASGRVIVANDPHRNVSNPSLRYIVHLDAPGWTVIGATEPVLPGVSIGHNGRVGWGLTILGTDQSDVYVETVNPLNPNEVLYQGAWEPITTLVDTVVVKGAAPEIIELRYTRHGPVLYEDRENNLAYAMRSTMQEPGSTGYLAGLRLDQVDTCVEFLEEIVYWKAPTENMVCGDAEGNISWHGSALSPARDGWDGRLPVPGTGEYEWTGFRTDLPSVLNPESGWIATANNDTHIMVPDYDPPLYFKTAGGFERYERLAELMPGLEGVSVDDMKALQHDAFNRAALEAMEHFKGWTAADPELETYRAELAAWDGVQRREERAPALWGELRSLLPDDGEGALSPAEAEAALATAVERLREEQGADPARWRWGWSNRSEFPHSLVSAYDLPAAERVGGSGTVAATGATFREIIDFADIDGSVGTNTPGQSGRPGSPFYGNLIENHANQEYFPLSFSREAVERNQAYRLVLRPGG